MARFLAAMPPKTWPFSRFQGFALDFATALGVHSWWCAARGGKMHVSVANGSVGGAAARFAWIGLLRHSRKIQPR
jgi:hypothetical protein